MHRLAKARRGVRDLLDPLRPLVRIEELYPFPGRELGQALSGYDRDTWLAIGGLVLGAQLLGHTLVNHVLRRISPTAVPFMCFAFQSQRPTRISAFSPATGGCFRSSAAIAGASTTS